MPTSEPFWKRKSRARTALRRDGNLTALARVVGDELLAWWSERRPDGPIFGQTHKVLSERLGFSEEGIRLACKQLERTGHLEFKRTGRADLVWPKTVTQQERSPKFGDQKFGDQKDVKNATSSQKNVDRKNTENLQIRLDLIHSAIVKRMNVGPVGWEVLQSLSEEELDRICSQYLRNILDENVLMKLRDRVGRLQFRTAHEFEAKTSSL